MIPSLHKPQLLVLDPRVPGWRELALGIRPGVTPLVLDTAGDGLRQITRALDEVGPVDTLHLVDEPHAGRVRFGANWLDLDVLPLWAAQLARLGAGIRPGGSFVLWGEGMASLHNEAFLRGLSIALRREVTAAEDVLADSQGSEDWLSCSTDILPACPADAVLPGALARFQAGRRAPGTRLAGLRGGYFGQGQHVPFSF